MNAIPSSPPRSLQTRLKKLVPLLHWASRYRRQDLVGDLMAGVIVTIMLMPQAMAYALLAGLPPQVGLYASILPLFLYGILGSSRTLAVGPVAIVSLLVANGVGSLAPQGSADYLQLALTLALLVGLIQLALGLFRLGFLVNFLSHPVLAGFTSAAALVIAFSQLKHLLGINIPRLEFFQLIVYALTHLQETNVFAVALGLASIALLLVFKYLLPGWLQRRGVRRAMALPLTRSAPFFVVLAGTLVVAVFQLHQTNDLSIVGQIPAGLPALTIPSGDVAIWQTLLPVAAAISFVSYMESIAVAKSLASKRREKVDANQELIALGIANVGAAVTGGYPVTGGFSRSVVNFEAGANTGLASMITAALIALTLIFLTPLFRYLPQAVLAAIVVVAVIGLVDVKTLRHIWHYNRGDAASFVLTFVVVLVAGVETGILVGVAAAMLIFIWRSSRPHVAIIGRVGNTEIYRNVLRHDVRCCPDVVAVRIDESLTFANAHFLEDTVLGIVADRPEVDHFILVGTAINFIDASALETLESLHHELRDAGVTLHLAAVKGPVLDRLRRIGFLDRVGESHIHLSTHDAIMSIGCDLAQPAPVRTKTYKDAHLDHVDHLHASRKNAG